MSDLFEIEALYVLSKPSKEYRNIVIDNIDIPCRYDIPHIYIYILMCIYIYILIYIYINHNINIPYKP